MKNAGIMAGIAVIALLVIGLAALSGISAPSTGTSNTTSMGKGSVVRVPVMMTDPAQVPSGTSALVFTYTSMKVNSTDPSGSGWVNAVGSGSVNLMAIQDSAQVMGYANLEAGSAIRQVMFNVTSVNITINGTTYSVPVSKPQVLVSISGNESINAASGVLIDYTPTVSAAFSQNSTVFIRVPAIKAAVVSGVNIQSAASIGATTALSAGAKAALADITPDVRIVSSSIAASGNTTTVSIVVQNSGNQSVVLNTVNVYGQQTVAAQSSARANASLSGSVNAALTGGLSGRAYGNLSVAAKVLAGIGLRLQSYGMQTFSVGSGGALVLVSGSSSVQGGMTVGPGATVTITYSGTATYNDGAFRTTPKAGATYRINVVGKEGAYATASATAS